MYMVILTLVERGVTFLDHPVYGHRVMCIIFLNFNA